MKDLPLSLLSRGCGRLVSSSGGAGGRDGRLDVCFTPQDYDVCKARETLLRLSSSGRLFAEAASTIPKTYSTRRGALLLYSQELVTMETSYRPDLGARKKKVIRRDTQQMKQRLSSLKELTAAILSYSNNQSFSSRLAPPLFPPLNLPPTLHRTSPASTHTTEAPASPGLLVHLNPQWLPANQNAAGETQAEGNKDEQDSERVRVDVFLHMPRTSRTPTPQPWVHYVPQEQQPYRDDILQHAEGNHHLVGDGVSHPNIKGVHDETECEDASIPDDRNPGDNDGGEKSISRTRHGSRGKPKQQMTVELKTNAPSGLLLRHQEVSRSVFDGLRWEEKAEPRCEVSSPDEHRPHRLPPIAEGGALTPQGGHAETRPDARPQGDGARVQSQENVNRLNKQPLVLPLLFPETDETKQRKGREKTKRQRFQVGGVGKEGGGRLPSGKGSAILLEPDKEPSPPVGVLGCVAGWKGPGKQSSLAFLQNHEPSDATRGLVRGVLPLELRDFQSGKSAGCLILGPDGEIIQVSLNDTSRDASQGDGDLRQQALQVLSTEGEELPWVIVLQTQPADTGGELELSTCVLQSDTPQSTHRGLYQGTESHLPRGHCASGELTFSAEQLSDLHSSTETNTRSPRGHTDAAMVGKKKTKSAEQVLQTRKGAKNRTRMPPLKEQGGKEELRGSSADEEEDEELSLTEHTEHLYESHHKRNKLQNISPRETPPKDADKWRKKKVTEGDAVTAGKREASPEESPESNEQRRRKMKEEKWQKPRNDDVQSVRILRHDGSTSGEAAETQDQSAPSHKKRIKNRERRRGEMRMNEEREDQGAVRQTVSVGRRRKRRGGQKNKELIAENPQNAPENEGAGIQQEMPADAHRPSTSLSSAAPTQRSDATTEEDTDDLLTSDKRSCIQSESSLRSTVPSSQRQPRSSVRSLASFSERTVPASVLGLASSHGRLSSCSTVMVTEEQLMLNPVKPEFPRPTNGEEEEEAAALRLAQRAERRRQEVERKRRQREEEERKQQEKEQTEDRMKNELEEERRKRAEDLRLKKLAEEEERRRREEEEQERARREQAQKERERRRQEEMRRQLEQLHQIRKQEEQRRKAELERLRLEEEKKQEEENQRLQQMDEAERTEYLHRKEQEEKERKKEAEERTRREQEAASLAAEEERLQAELLARQMALLQQQLVSERDFMLEAGGLEKTQGISRPWIYSYFTLFQLLGSNPVRAESQTP